MKTLLLAFSLTFIAALQAQAVLAEEESQDGSGTWYLKATASSMKIPGKKLGSVPVSPITVKALEGGNLEVKFTILIGGRCQEVNTILEKTEKPGKYTAYGGKHVVHIFKSPVEDHYIFGGVVKLPGHQIRIANLVGRDPEPNQEALVDFERVVGAGGLDVNISIPMLKEGCSPASD